MVDSVSSSALQGIQRAQNGMQRNASNIARSNQPDNPKDMTRSLVELNQHKNAGMASMKVLKAADEMLGSLLDVKA